HRINPALHTPYRKSMKLHEIVLNQTLTPPESFWRISNKFNDISQPYRRYAAFLITEQERSHSQQ
ncbi:MAG: hypothetical protein ACK43M_19220, partial [Allorhizobium sp.]